MRLRHFLLASGSHDAGDLAAAGIDGAAAAHPRAQLADVLTLYSARAEAVAACAEEQSAIDAAVRRGDLSAPITFQVLPVTLGADGSLQVHLSTHDTCVWTIETIREQHGIDVDDERSVDPPTPRGRGR